MLNSVNAEAEEIHIQLSYSFASYPTHPFTVLTSLKSRKTTQNLFFLRTQIFKPFEFDLDLVLIFSLMFAFFVTTRCLFLFVRVCFVNIVIHLFIKT